MPSADELKAYAGSVAVVGGLFAVIVRPRIPAATWAKLGVLGEIIDVLLGNYGHAANAGKP